MPGAARTAGRHLNTQLNSVESTLDVIADYTDADARPAVFEGGNDAAQALLPL